MSAGDPAHEEIVEAELNENFVTGIGSALLDNVPLTAAPLKAETILNPTVARIDLFRWRWRLFVGDGFDGGDHRHE